MAVTVHAATVTYDITDPVNDAVTTLEKITGFIVCINGAPIGQCFLTEAEANAVAASIEQALEPTDDPRPVLP